MVENKYPLVSSLDWTGWGDSSAGWMTVGVSAGWGLGATSPGGCLWRISVLIGFGGEMSVSWGLGGRSFRCGLGGRSPNWGLGGRSDIWGFGGSSPGLGGNSESCGLGAISPGWGLSANTTFCGVFELCRTFWNRTGSGGWLILSIDGWWMVSILRRVTIEKQNVIMRFWHIFDIVLDHFRRKIWGNIWFVIVSLSYTSNCTVIVGWKIYTVSLIQTKINKKYICECK